MSDEMLLELARLYLEVELRVKREQLGELFQQPEDQTNAHNATGHSDRLAAARLS